LDGHSDADVLIHSVIDSILGALAKGDIGKLFPNNDEQYKNINSRILLRKVFTILVDEGFQLGNLDATICAQKPKLQDYIQQMRNNISEDLNTDINNISIKATTEEGLGISGREEGISSYSVVLIHKK